MNILVVGKVTSNQVDRLREEAKKKGHHLENCASYDLLIKAEKGKLDIQVKDIDLKKIDLIHLLVLGDRRWEWYLACHELKNRFGIAIVDEKYVDDIHKIFFTPTAEIVKQTDHGFNFPKTAMVVHEKTLDEALKGFKFPLIFKNTVEHRGRGVHLVKNKSEIIKIMEESRDISPSFYIREFIPNDGDIRVFTVGFKAIGAMKRTPPKGDFRSNISRGGEGSQFDLTARPDVKKIAEDLSKLNHSEVAGVDVILHAKTGVPYVIEINQSPQFAGLEKYTLTNAAKSIIEFFETKIQK